MITPAKQGFKRCYLETTAFLKEAVGLYEHLGFEHIAEPLGCTGHVDCEVRMLKVL
ncbi:acetyltransferase YjgM [Klebsiella michiganensis]|nr:acetyltransferase YjgM [Klebsiella michiganensis]